MKKLSALLLTLFVGFLSAHANHDLKLIDGSLAQLKNGGEATITINMDGTTFDNKMPLREDDRFSDVDKNIPEFKSEFIREFNEHSKKFRMVKDDADCGYSFVIDITNLDVYVTFFSFKGGVATKVWGTLTIKDNNTNENIAVIELKEFESSGFTYDVSLEETFEVIAKRLAKRINKGK